MVSKSNPTDWQTRLRLWAALVMAVYAIGYNVYYSLGIFSIEAIEYYQNLVYKVWPLFWLIPIVILVHVTLGLWKLFKRNTLRLPLWEITQITFGITIPFFLIPHIIYTYGLFLFFGVNQNYLYNLLATYPHFTWQYIAMTLIIWIHAQIGIHVVLRMRRWYPKIKFLIIIIFSLMPILGITGYLKAGMEGLNVLNNTSYTAFIRPTNEQINFMKMLSYSVYIIFPVLYVFVLTARGIKISIKNKNKNIIVQYSQGTIVNVFPRTTILETSRIAKIPHASICGGRGRCTTCRVKIDSGMENLSPIGARENIALNKIGAAPEIRLACQAECKKEKIGVTLLLPPDIKSLRARKETKYSVGTEMNLIVMFTDLRGFTKLSEEKFPYDVVFILNRYFSYMGEVIEKNKGTIDKFLGDGILAFFGFKSDHKTASISALKSALEMAEKLVEINNQLKNVLKEPLELGISIHYGNVILGDLGYKEKTSLTIIGDTVNTASRLESLNKKLESQMIVSSNLAEISGIDFSHLKKHKAEIRGKKDLVEIYVIKNILSELKI